MIELNYGWILEEESQMYTVDSDKRSEYDMKYKSVVENVHGRISIYLCQTFTD